MTARPRFAGPATVFVVAAVLLLAAGAVITSRVPFVHVESATYLANFLDGRPALEQIFDVRRNDFGLYQARELSYAFDLVDAHAVAAVFATTGRFVPVSFVHVTLCALIAALNFTVVRRLAPSLGTLAALAPSALFVSSPAVLLGTRHFRTAKVVAACALFVLLWSVWAAVTEAGATGRHRRLLAAAASALVLTLADRQGTFFVVLLVLGVLAVRVTDAREGRPSAGGHAALALVLLVALAVSVGYDLWLGPALIAHFGHQDVNWSLQSGAVRLASLRDRAVIGGAALWLTDSVAMLFGSLGPWLGALAIGLGAGACAVLARRRRVVVAYAGVVVALVALAALMEAVHPPLDAADVRVTYYNLPLLALALAALSLALAAAARASWWPRRRRTLAAVALAMVALNLAAVPRLSRRVLTGSDASYVGLTRALDACLMNRARNAGAFFADLPSGAPWPGRFRRLCERYRALRPVAAGRRVTDGGRTDSPETSPDTGRSPR